MTEAQREKCLSFFAKIHEDVTAHYHREIFADWLDEQGLWKESLGQRWLARNQREIVLGDDHLFNGWWRENTATYPKAGLPETICGEFSGRFGEFNKVISPTDPVKAEFAFMERCTELDWDQDSGEPKEKK
jgi:hypothetical protein